MFHKAVNVEFKDHTVVAVTFQNGEVKEYAMSRLFKKYPRLKALEDRMLFYSGRLMGAYGIVWNDDLDIEVETIYENGKTVKTVDLPLRLKVAHEITEARAKAGLSQKELSDRTGIDQSDISKIETGKANPSISTMERIAKALGTEVTITFDEKTI